MKIRIQNDGKPSYMTWITNAETGEKIEGVTRIELEIDAKDPSPIPYALLCIANPIIDIIADAEIKHVCPVCGREKE